MSDIKLYDLKNNKQIKRCNVLDVKQMIERHLKDVFKIDLLAKELKLEENSNDAISYLGLDENMQLVIIEYRYGKFGSLTKKGLFYIDYIKDHISRFKMIANDYKKGIADAINYNARLLVFCDDANSYDHYAIKQLPYTIELIQIHLYDGYVAFEKVYQSKNIDHSLLKFNLKALPYYDLYKYISDYVLSLGDEVIETANNNFVYFRKINTFAYMIFEKEIKLSILLDGKYVSYNISDADAFDKIVNMVEKSYDEC
ncbi:MAG: hypothetical protein J6X93_02430 [Bacilli bacterium]|nr:hypothetical protein [Bacilli bacterium]